MSMKDRLQIMVVDDMATSRGLITQALDEIGIKNYVWEKDGQDAFQTLSSTPVHLVISDYNMPNMDGLQLLQSLRSNQPTSRIGFVLVTGRADDNIINRGKQLSMNNYLLKPFSTEQMKSCLERVVGKL